MFTIKNAVKNIYRYKNKYIIFGVLYLILILTASVCVNIFVQMRQVTNTIVKEYSSVVTFTAWASSVEDGRFILEYRRANPESADGTRLLKEEYLKLPDVVNHIDEIRFLTYNFSVNHLKEDAAELDVELHIGGDVISVNSQHFEPVIVSGYNLSLLHLVPEDFILESGRMFENGGEAVIGRNTKFIPKIWDENTLSEYDNLYGDWIPSGIYEAWNDLDLGDKIIIKNDDGIYKEFTIVGIQTESPDYDENTNRRLIYTTLDGAEYFDAIASPNRESSRIGPFIQGKSFSQFEIRNTMISFGYEALAYLDFPENYFRLENEMAGIAIIEPLFPDFRALTNITRNMYHFAVLFIVLTGIIILCVTIISTIILLSNRRYEIAVLRSVGMKKSRLILSYLIEKLAFIWGIAVISLIIAPFIARGFTGSIFENIKEFVSAEFFENLTQGVNFALLLQNVGLVFGGTTAVVMLSLILACINIVRFEPLKIFNKRY